MKTSEWPTPQGYARGKAANSAPGLTPLDIQVRGLYAEPALSQLILFAEAFPVSRTRLLVDGWEAPTSGISGQSSPELFARLGPDGSWLKTYRDCSPQMLDGSSEAFSETWPRAGTMRNGTAFQLPPSAPVTKGIESGLLPTPIANNWGFNQSLGENTAIRPSLKMMARQNTAEHDSGKHHGQPDTLHSAVKRWPTPQASDWKRAHAYSAEERGHSPQLRHVLTGQLNPTWVEWLMGFPLGWTVCEAWGTHSSRRLRNGLAGVFKKRK